MERKITLKQLLSIFSLFFLLTACQTVTTSQDPASQHDANYWGQMSNFDQRPLTDPFVNNNPTDAAYSGAPIKVALLLPMSGKLASSGQAIHNGFMAAYYSNQNSRSAPQKIEIYNTAADNVQNVYRKAVKDGANLIIGPLTKEDVQLIEKMGSLPVPTLALNYSFLDNKTVKNLYEYGLSPQDEAAQVATKARGDGYARALVIVPADSWGRGVAQTFSQAFTSRGGQVVETLNYTNSNNLDKEIQRALHVKEVKRNAAADGPTRRQDIDMIFLVATPQKARQINPLLKFYYAENLPVYATSQVYSGTPSQLNDKDLNGIKFCDMPWILEDSGKIRQDKARMYELIPDIRAQNARLYAFGLDAYTLALQLRINNNVSYSGINGVTGTLYLGNNHQVFRQLEWAQFRNGIPRT